MCTLEEKSWSETVAELKQKFVVTYKVSWYPSTSYPPAGGFVPPLCAHRKMVKSSLGMRLGLKEPGVTFLLLFAFVQLEWIFWPAAQVLNFYFLPSSLRVTYTNLVYLGWSMVLSYLKHNVRAHLNVYTNSLNKMIIIISYTSLSFTFNLGS